MLTALCRKAPSLHHLRDLLDSHLPQFNAITTSTIPSRQRSPVRLRRRPVLRGAAGAASATTGAGSVRAEEASVT